jgi:SWI/SNF-related matrix-associated actin-dependent regulator 1 of chromatin subfamily A
MKTALPHQVEGIAFLVNGGTLLADDMGLGKTYQATSAAELLPDTHLPILVVCPAVIMGGWAVELHEQTHAKPLLLKSTNLDQLDDGQNVIVSVDLVGRNAEVHDALRRRMWRVLIVDEAHYLGNEESARTEAILTGRHGLVACAARIFLLSGTPTRKHVGQLWPLIHATAWGRIDGMTVRQFEDRYCQVKVIDGIRVIKGNRRAFIPELRKRLDGWWLRRRKDDPALGLNLPPKQRRVVPLVIENLTPIQELEASPEGQALRAALEFGDMRLAADLDDMSVSRMMRLLGILKAPYAVEYCQHLLNDREARAVILWCQHLDVMDICEAKTKAAGLRYRRIDGSTPAATRTKIEAEMQAGKLDLIIGQITAAGVGLTLTHADHAVFVEAQWIPTPNVQAEDRIYRIGQDLPVWMHYLAAYDTLDMALQAIVQRRMDEWNELDPSNKRTK